MCSYSVTPSNDAHECAQRRGQTSSRGAAAGVSPPPPPRLGLSGAPRPPFSLKSCHLTEQQRQAPAVAMETAAGSWKERGGGQKAGV